MTLKATTPRRAKREQNDAIRIVPLSLSISALKPVPDALLAALATPRLTYRGGALITSVAVYVIYWGVAWNKAPLKDLRSKLDGFFDFIVTSTLMDELAEYSVPAFKIGHGTRLGSIVVTTPAPKPSVSDSNLQQFLQNLIGKGGGVPKPTANTLYFIYVPPGTRVVQGGSASCQGSAVTTMISEARPSMRSCPTRAARAVLGVLVRSTR